VLEYKQRFIDFLMECGAFRLGEFRLKSGRLSPTFVNTGLVRDGRGIFSLGEAYAASTLDAVGADGFDCVFGPAYKGVPLAVATVIALANQGVVKGYLFDRKEQKVHGEEAAKAGAAKVLVGYRPEGGERIVLVDDVITDGATKVQSVELLKSLVPDVSFPALVIAVDRQEVTIEGDSAAAKFTELTGVPVIPTVTMTEILEHLASTDRLPDADRTRCLDYLSEYGTGAARAWVEAAR
jgi:orotate phosphoribosyltransferase